MGLLLVGTGVVGSALIDILQRPERPPGVSLVGVANSRGVRLAETALSPEEARAVVTLPPGRRQSIDDDILDALASHRPNAVLVDATATDGMEDLYGRALARGIHVVTANKKPLAAPWPKRQRLFDTSLRAHDATLRYAATVGAGLPVIETLQELVRTGDRVTRMDCVLSGTLGFLSSELQGGTSLSRAVAIAKERGFTEPDPREDLGGHDVARKVVVLARELGAPLELEHVERAPFVPAELLDASSAERIARDLERLDPDFAARVSQAAARGEKLVYLARIEVEAERVRASAGPVTVPLAHPAARLSGAAALVAFTTARHAADPLIVQGSGAGGVVTAEALLGDVLKATCQVLAKGS